VIKIKERVHEIENDIIVNKDRASIVDVIKTTVECDKVYNVSGESEAENNKIKIVNEKETKAKDGVRIVHANDEMIIDIEK